MVLRRAKRNIRKTRQQDSVLNNEGSGLYRVMKERPQPSCRSACLQSQWGQIVSKVVTKHQLPSPTSITFGSEDPKRERKRAQEPEDPLAPVEHLRKRPRTSTTRDFEDTFGWPAADLGTSHNSSISHPGNLKRPRVAGALRNQKDSREHDSIAHWASTYSWPPEFGQIGTAMSEGSPSKRRSESTHRSDRLERLAKNGIFMKTSSLMQKSSKELCQNLLRHKLTPIQYMAFPRSRLSTILEHVQDLNESRVRRDITPWIVPSAETLFFCSDLSIDYIGDEVDAEWIRCLTMGSTRPKPDYTAGLLLNAFTKDEIQKLKNYSSPRRPFLFTPDLSFPFLICEVKTGEQGLNKADQQNIHSASIAVRAIIELYQAAFGGSNPEHVNELSGKALVFTVSHDNDRVCLYAHYAVLSVQNTAEPEFFRYLIAFFSLSANDGADTSAASDFVRNVYESIAPKHRQRIKEAAALLAAPGEQTNMSFTASESGPDAVAALNSSQETQAHDNLGIKTPSLSTSVLHRKEILRLTEQVELQRSENQVQISRLLAQMGQQREQMERQMEQQRKQMEQQIEQQKDQLHQQMVLIMLLKQGDV